MTGEGPKKRAPMGKKPVVDRLCRTRTMPPGALAVNTSRLKHDTRKKNTTSSTRQRTAAAPPPQTTAPPPPPPHTTAAPPPPQTTTVPPPPHTTAAPPSLHTTATHPPPHTNITRSPPQTTGAAPPPQTTDTSPPTFEECTFVPTPGVTQHVLQGPAIHHTTIAVEEEERDRTVSDEEQEAAEQAFSSGQRPMISIVGNGLAPSGVAAEAIRKVFIKLYKGKFLQYSELKARNRRKERAEYFNIFKSLVQWEPCYNAKMQQSFHTACGKRISDMFGKIRKKGTKPDWMGEKVYAYLLEGWKSDDFKRLSRQNKTNRASTKGERSIPRDVELIMMLL